MGTISGRQRENAALFGYQPTLEGVEFGPPTGSYIGWWSVCPAVFGPILLFKAYKLPRY